MTQITGIDVSPWQKLIDYELLATSGHSFAYVKGTEGNAYISKVAVEQRDRIRQLGWFTGPYHFGRWDTADNASTFAAVKADAIDEAHHFFDTYGPTRPGDLSQVLDLEWISGKKLPPDLLVYWTRTFLDECDALFNRWSHLYTGKSFWRYCLLPASVKSKVALELTSHPLWLVDYTPGIKKPQRFAGVTDEWAAIAGADGTDWTFWQYTGSGACPGVTGKCDLNRFNGTMDDLRQVAGLDRLGA